MPLPLSVPPLIVSEPPDIVFDVVPRTNVPSEIVYGPLGRDLVKVTDPGVLLLNPTLPVRLTLIVPACKIVGAAAGQRAASR